jgi:hypothetical protein
LKNVKGSKDDLLVSICGAVEADYYLSAFGSAEYIEKDHSGGAFADTKIKLFYQNYNHPKHPQLYNDFVSYLSIIDLLFNVGFKNSLEIIRKGRQKPIFYKDIDKQNAYKHSGD